ncbi:hypothetical protein [Nonomuraea sp. NPDC048916]|uniref:hypothetical protein n=1 Tax=Nonomuraea sp. NPDC048916 TaxID=3154232 RepID=UPI0034081A06
MAAVPESTGDAGASPLTSKALWARVASAVGVSGTASALALSGALLLAVAFLGTLAVLACVVITISLLRDDPRMFARVVCLTGLLLGRRVQGYLTALREGDHTTPVVIKIEEARPAPLPPADPIAEDR